MDGNGKDCDWNNGWQAKMSVFPHKYVFNIHAIPSNFAILSDRIKQRSNVKCLLRLIIFCFFRVHLMRRISEYLCFKGWKYNVFEKYEYVCVEYDCKRANTLILDDKWQIWNSVYKILLIDKMFHLIFSCPKRWSPRSLRWSLLRGTRSG